MRIGFSTIYSFRPHVEHTWYLAHLAKQAGHEVRFLTCDSDLPTCYSQLLHERGKWRECLQCRMGGIRSYTVEGVSSIGQCTPRESSPSMVVRARSWAQSSASTLGRFESEEDYAGESFKDLVSRIEPAVAQAFVAALGWMIREKLDAVCIFNGRIDVTRAILEAAKSLGLPVVSHERTWFGDGIQLLPGEHCLGLQSVWNMVSAWRDKPLTHLQAVRAASLAARRFLQTNLTEWRAYNLNALKAPWPVAHARRRLLILPGSTNEVWGHPDWASGWRTQLDAFDAVIERLGLASSDLVLRCHPNWAEKIGLRDGHLPEAYYSNWASRRGIHCIDATDRTSTMHLIEQCDAIIVASSSAAVEAAVLGKTVISTSPSIYHLAGFTVNVHGPADMEALEQIKARLDQSEERLPVSDLVVRHALRFAYAMVWRIPQFVSHVRARKTTEFDYFDGADLSRFTRLFSRQELEPDDATFDASGVDGEDEVLSVVRGRGWEKLLNPPALAEPSAKILIKRRGVYGWVDPLRRMAKVGDR
jgi:hypothetical protein